MSDTVYEPVGVTVTVEATGLQAAILERLQSLPIDRQLEVQDFVEFLQQKAAPRGPRKSLEGLWAGQGVDLSEAEIDALRREMWSGQPIADEDKS